jgi:hypothetical protein
MEGGGCSIGPDELVHLSKIERRFAISGPCPRLRGLADPALSQHFPGNAARNQKARQIIDLTGF